MQSNRLVITRPAWLASWLADRLTGLADFGFRATIGNPTLGESARARAHYVKSRWSRGFLNMGSPQESCLPENPSSSSREGGGKREGTAKKTDLP